MLSDDPLVYASIFRTYKYTYFACVLDLATVHRHVASSAAVQRCAIAAPELLWAAAKFSAEVRGWGYVVEM
eukprot:2554223-Pleurochrysis_carterae.AAC.2